MALMLNPLDNPRSPSRLSRFAGRAIATAWRIGHFVAVLAIVAAVLWLASWFLWWYLGAAELRG
ncbi:MAG: hypothetical protein JNG90_10670 [Planctomycetaceae bacterium]|nr:hypothetical protein [Planctomycetaceae bacterium]